MLNSRRGTSETLRELLIISERFFKKARIPFQGVSKSLEFYGNFISKANYQKSFRKGTARLLPIVIITLSYQSSTTFLINSFGLIARVPCVVPWVR